MQHGHVLLGVRHLRLIKDVGVAQTQVIILVEEALLLHAGHVQHVKVADDGDEILDLGIGAGVGGVDAVKHILRGLELVRTDEHEVDVAEAAQRLDQGVHGAAEGQIAAQADGQVGDAAEAGLQGGQIGQGLRRMHVPAIAGVDDRHGCGTGGNERRSFLRMTDGDDVHVVGDGLQRVGDGLTLGDGRELCARETDHLAAESQHGGFEAQTSARARLIKQSGEHPAFAGVRHFLTMGIDVLRFTEQFLDLTKGKIIERDDAFSDHRRFNRRFEY